MWSGQGKDKANLVRSGQKIVPIDTFGNDTDMVIHRYDLVKYRYGSDSENMYTDGYD